MVELVVLVVWEWETEDGSDCSSDYEEEDEHYMHNPDNEAVLMMIHTIVMYRIRPMLLPSSA